MPQFGLDDNKESDINDFKLTLKVFSDIVMEGKSLDDDQNEYGFLLGYLRFKTFRTHIPEKEMERHVNRNMLCHGVQLNYGTKEHALKTILCIDALAWVAEVIAKSITPK